MMKNRIKAAKFACFTLGTVLLLSALFLVLYNIHEDRRGGEQAATVLSALREELPAPAAPAETTMPAAEEYDLFSAYEEEKVQEMQTVEIDGKVYVGYISIPALGVELPVLSEWSYPNLKAAPCRYAGNIYENDLILCAHNYNSHFGRIGSLHTDDEIIFTDASGNAHLFHVVNIEQLPGTAVEDMKFEHSDEWDLTLFTCTLNGRSRVTVRAVRAD